MLQQNELGCTPLSHACVAGHVETAMVLLDHRTFVESDYQNKVWNSILYTFT